MTTTYKHFARNLCIVNGQVTGAEQASATHFDGATHGFNGTQWVPLPPKDGGFPVGAIAGAAVQAAAPVIPDTLGPYQVLKPWQASKGDFGKGWRLRDPVDGIVLSAGQARQALKFGKILDVVLTASEIKILDSLVAANAPQTEAINGRRRR